MITGERFLQTSFLFVVAVSSSFVWTLVHAQISDRRVDWYAVNGELNERHQSLSLSSGEHTVATRVGWVCVISPESTNQARQIACFLEDKSVSFSVQCDPGRDQDHGQLQFAEGTGTSRRQDFVEVGCKIGR